MTASGAAPVGRARPAALVALVAVGVLRLLLAVAGVVVVTSMIVTGLRPNAELEGLLVVIGGVLAGPVLLYTVLAVLALTSLRRRPDGRRRLGLTTAAVVVDVVLAVGGVVAVVRAGTNGDLRPGSVLLVGLLWLVLAVPGVLALLSLRADRIRTAA
ncbi:hypothetical protein [Lapillicoccus jejuensis]|uniref:Uncharacterized protein n=1 Tax=Lapillicoccus jejuensis TaxID=402171 RepID=A0A542DYU7_9MICO|nr:hypothetical protein [Lapillicoccus jejuensis]TQJ08104.1 hypothetical protein FB458_1186 [Lapillicoccus jejuensis]